MKFQLCLGWLAVVGGLGVAIAIVVGSLVSGEVSPAMIGKLVATLFLIGWGIFHLRRCRRINKLEGIDKKQ